jgi:hypothetical protein
MKKLELPLGTVTRPDGGVLTVTANDAIVNG